MKPLLFTCCLALLGAAPARDVACPDVPALNQQVLAYVHAHLTQQVGRGECWDLPAAALRSTGATWDGRYRFGRPVDPRTACVFPGDVVQFEGVVVAYERGGRRYREEMGHHSAVVYQVTGPGAFVLAHQNVGPVGRKVGLSPLDLRDVQRGQLTIYRPVP
ncbi:hypothetical protein [Hymenobacter arizonensis]|uniref:BBC1/AIM3 cysteine proteinase-fold domain-containing protein n=1 Tax=Hymenobacter arizonensis TaxID=1227077 RepID=A0A1I6BRH0_HYMAR|nr:hypothetical protein [Hymenobacter arizonensis]SFQ83464.1 hypothetical protein SAMN04515668_4972 [Hymenobacter arizonensis]